MKTKLKKSPQEAAHDFRSLALICRQQAAIHPETSWTWLSEAERFEHLAAQVNASTRPIANGCEESQQPRPESRSGTYFRPPFDGPLQS